MKGLVIWIYTRPFHNERSNSDRSLGLLDLRVVDDHDGLLAVAEPVHAVESPGAQSRSAQNRYHNDELLVQNDLRGDLHRDLGGLDNLGQDRRDLRGSDGSGLCGLVDRGGGGLVDDGSGVSHDDGCAFRGDKVGLVINRVFVARLFAAAIDHALRRGASVTQENSHTPEHVPVSEIDRNLEGDPSRTPL